MTLYKYESMLTKGKSQAFSGKYLAYLRHMHIQVFMHASMQVFDLAGDTIRHRKFIENEPNYQTI